MNNKDLIIKLDKEKKLSKTEWMKLLETADGDDRELARTMAQEIARG